MHICKDNDVLFVLFWTIVFATFALLPFKNGFERGIYTEKKDVYHLWVAQAILTAAIRALVLLPSSPGP